MDPIRLISDQAIAELNNPRTDALGFSSYADVIARIVRGTRGPFTIGVFGEWGMGKTSLMRMVEQRVQATPSKEHAVIPVWFNAWMFEKAEYPIVPLIKSIVEALNARPDVVQRSAEAGRRLIDTLESLAAAFKLKGKIGLPGRSAELAAEMDAGGFIDHMRQRSNTRRYGAPQNDAYENIFAAFHDISDNVVPRSVTIMVLIDDLDRCFPENAVRLLEGVKLVLSQPGFIFVLGASRVIIEEYLESKYQNQYGITHYNGKAYLDKMIQLSFDIPPHTKRMDAFTKRIIADLGDVQTARDLNPIASVIGGVCRYNPRAVIRFINRLIADSAIYRQNNTGGRLPIGVFAVTRSLQLNWRDFYGLLVSDDQTEDREYCTIISTWTTSDVERWEKYDPNAPHIGLGSDLTQKVPPGVLKQLAALLAGDRVLRELMQGRLGREWLKNHEQRETSVSFLSAQSAAKAPQAPAPAAWSSWPKPAAAGTVTDEDLYRSALEVVLETGKPSTSLLQRRLQIGYGKALQMILKMETSGVISPYGTEPQVVLVPSLEEALMKSVLKPPPRAPSLAPPAYHDENYFFPIGQ